MTIRIRSSAPFLALFFLTITAIAQTPPAPPPAPAQGSTGGLTREQMWWAPTAEDWQLPCLITFQRTYEDALAVSKQSGMPILICVNMDGEPASEHYAGVRYRQPDTALLYSPYVAVIASVYRHTPRDYDDQGNRVLCPRFGSVTCGEHIAIEPALFEQFFDGKRVAPRHIMVEVEKDSAETYDIYYAFDTDTIFRNLREGIANRPPPPPLVRGDRPVAERVASHDVEDRAVVEQAYKAGNAGVRRVLLEAAVRHRDVGQTEVLRLALFGFDLELARLARKALAESDSPEAVDLIAEALRVPMDPAEREALVAALVRLGSVSPRAQTLVAVYQGLAARSSTVDLAVWGKALAAESSAPASADSYELGARLEGQVEATLTRPADAQARLEMAESFVALAASPDTRPRFAQLMLQDARRAGLEAEKLGAGGWRLHAALAVAFADLGDYVEAQRRAEAAMADMPPDAQSEVSMRVLALFAQARQQAIGKAVREKAQWPAHWLSDVHAAYAVLARHPLGTDRHVASHHDFLASMSASSEAGTVLDEGLGRFPDSWLLHERLRVRFLAERGVEGLESGYATLLARAEASPNLEWYAGYASIVAAEFRRRAGEPAQALAAYDRALAHYEGASEKNPAGRESADHYAALALAGRARLAMEQGDLPKAVEEVRASFVRRPAAAATLDGLNLSPVDTAKMLLSRLKEGGQDELAKSLQTALDALDPELLRLPAYEREGPTGTPRGNRPRRQGTPPGR